MTQLFLIWLTNIPLSILISFSLRIPLSGYLGCFYILATVYSAAVNIWAQVSFSIMYFSGYLSNSEIAGSSVQFSCSVVSDCLQPHESQHARPPCPSPLQEFTQTISMELVMPSSHLKLYRTLLILPPIPPNIRVFSNESTLGMRWPKY